MSRKRESGLTKSELLLLLLHVDIEHPIQGRTRLAKLLFLVQKEILETGQLGAEGETYEFRADRYGPFSDEIFDEVEFLSDAGLIQRSGENENETFRITDLGSEFVKQRILPKSRPTGVEDVKRLRTKFGSVSLSQLLQFVYAKYPEYAVKSVIR